MQSRDEVEGFHKNQRELGYYISLFYKQWPVTSLVFCREKKRAECRYFFYLDNRSRENRESNLWKTMKIICKKGNVGNYSGASAQAFAAEPHSSSHENYFQCILGSVSCCVVILRKPPYWSVRVASCNFKLCG